MIRKFISALAAGCLAFAPLAALAADQAPLKSVNAHPTTFGTGDTVGVAHGGTGDTSLTAHCVLIGAGTSAAHLVCPGTSGLPLASAGSSADPAFAQIACGALSDASAFCNGASATNLTGTVASARLSGSYTGITGLGTVTAGTWNGTVIGSAYGGAGSVTGILKANGSGTVSAATSGTDYQGPITLTTTGTSGAATFSGGTLNIPQYSGGGGGGGLFNQVLSSTPTATSTGLVASANASVNNIATGAQVLNTGSLGYAHAAPTYSGTYSIKALLGWNDFISQFNGPTICLGDGTNFVCFGYGLGTVGSSNAQVAIQKRVVSGAGLAFSSNISTASNYLPAQNFIWVKVYFDGTSVNFYVSSDGAAWVLVSTQNPAAFASNYNTVAIQSGSGVTGTSVSVLSWTQGVN
jgi:hypothetical protein